MITPPGSETKRASKLLLLKNLISGSKAKKCVPLKADSLNDARPCVALRRHALTLTTTQPNARIDSISYSLCSLALRLIRYFFPFAKFNTMQRKALASFSEPHFSGMHACLRNINF